jgi:endonuclease/exonuclease/phosphatase family metal-dependent hydrolase
MRIDTFNHIDTVKSSYTAHGQKKQEPGAYMDVVDRYIPTYSYPYEDAKLFEKLSHTLRKEQGAGLAGTPSTPQDITIVAYNVENMFEDRSDRKDDRMRKTKNPEEMKAVAKTLNSTGADIIVLEEVENKAVLNTLVDKYMKSSDYPERILVPGNDPRGINVAILSHFPVKDVESHADLKFPLGHDNKQARFSRDLLEADIQVAPHYELTVCATHLKSQIGGEKADVKRLAEAREIRSLMEKEMKAYPEKKFIIAGDFNDTPDSKPVQMLVGKGERSLSDPLNSLPKIEQHTYDYRGNKQRLDYILLSPGAKKDYEKDSAHVIRTPETDIGSDHCPIELKLSIPQEKAA